MEEPNQQASPSSDRCIVCGKPEFEEGYTNKMCADCRTKKSQLSVPLWVKVFAAGILLLVLVDIPRSQKFFIAGIHYARGVKAQNNNQYVTAEKEFSKIATMLPDFTENNLRLIVCCERNLDFENFNDVFSRVSGKKSEEKSLIEDANTSIGIMDEYRPGNELDTLLAQIKNAPSTVYIDSIKQYSLRSKDDFARYILANNYYDIGNYQSSDSLINLVLFGEDQNFGALSLKAVIKREQGEYDSAMYFYDKMLERNPESLVALDGKARIELKRKHDEDALKYATMAYSLDSTNSYSLEAMILTRFFENRKVESEHLLATLKTEHPEDSTLIIRTENIVQGKTIYR